jgi:hypothetical protein
MRLSRRIAFFFILVAVPLATIEILLQGFYRIANGAWLPQRVSPPLYAADAHRCYGLRPNLAFRHATNEFAVDIFTNAQGFRTDRRRRDTDITKRPGIQRVLFLGPSFAFGWGSDHEDSFVGIVEAELQQLSPQLEVINAGVPAQPSEQQACWLRDVGFAYEPDIVVQTVYGHPGDLAVGCPSEISCPVVQDGRLYTRAPTFRLRVIAGAKNSGIVFYGWYFYNLVLAADRMHGTGKELYSESSADPGSVHEVVAQYLAYSDFTRHVTGTGTRVVILYIPLSYVVHAEDRRRWSHIAPPDAEAEALAEELTGLLDPSRVTYINATPTLADAGRRDRMYFWLDIHLTPAGNRIVADALLREMRGLIVK